MAFADLGVADEREKDDWIEWIPIDGGRTRWAVPVPGFLEDLEATHERFAARSSGKGVDTDTRPSVYRLQAYERTGLARPPYATFGLRTLDGEEIFSQPWRNVVEIAAWMRHAAGENLKDADLGEPLSPYVFGHPENQADANHRLSYVPLPSIHSAHGDGRVRRVMVTEPLGAHGAFTRALESKWRGAYLQKDGHNRCSLTPQEDALTHYYTGEGERWNSVTPVILHGHNADRGAISVAKTEKLLLRAFEMTGHPGGLIQSLAFQTAPLWPGTGAAVSIPVPDHLDKYPRYHVQVVFKDKVAGPLLAGIGRHFGIGVFAAAG
jgi:CRISPR-associated protein Csb2